MVVLFHRAPRSPATWWPGRLLLSALDGALWPILWIAVVLATPLRGGVLGLVVVTWALLALPFRLHRAICVNEHYWFTTWRWGRAILMLSVIGMLMKVLLLLAT